ncbi:la-related protein 1C [Pyrus x bretschneideri]|uniref:la-related protein 1C n=1 Tax=Pyrus x bretschneideri TaxID=225117 RepID=UPI00202F2EE4|nr:la-related protein 1C [Pyrus x bretschneideri]
MAMAADSSVNHHSPRGPEFSTDGGGGVVDKRSSLPSPWAKVVRGGELEAVQSPPSLSSSLSSLGNLAVEQTPFSDGSQSSKAARSSPPPHTPDGFSAADSPNGHNSNAGRPKKPAWNKPSNSVVEVSPVTVMDASSWPALSESARASPKLPVDPSPKTVSETIVNQESVPVSQGPVIAHSPNSKRHPANSANQNSTSNHAPARQRSIKRGGSGNNGGGHAHSGFGHPVTPPPPPPFPVFPILPNGYGNLVPAIPDPSPRDPSFRGSNWDARPVGGFVPQPHPVNDHRNSRRGNFGPRPRGDGHYHNNHGGKRDQDRGNYMHPRDVHMHQHRAPPMGLVRPLPPNNAAFPPQPARPFASPMGFPEFVYIPTLPLEPIRGMPPFISQPPHPAMFYPVAESPLPSLIINQIDYYFSDANLIKDDFLRSNMDAQGWIPISLIASFPRVKSLTTNIQLILDSLRASSIVEVQDDKVRRRNEWTKWISTAGQLPAESGSPSTLSSSVLSDNTLANSFGKMTVEVPSQNSMACKPDPNSVAIPESCSTESTSQSQLPNGDVTQTDH